MQIQDHVALYNADDDDLLSSLAVEFCTETEGDTSHFP